MIVQVVGVGSGGRFKDGRVAKSFSWLSRWAVIEWFQMVNNVDTVRNALDNARGTHEALDCRTFPSATEGDVQLPAAESIRTKVKPEA